MSQIIKGFFRFNLTTRLPPHAVYFQRRLVQNLASSDRVWAQKDYRKKNQEDEQPMKEMKSLGDRARALIFGERKYENLSTEEKKIVDLYQQKKFEEDGIVLPNTRAALEQAEIEQMILKRHNKT